jgi:hypothetical protein
MIQIGSRVHVAAQDYNGDVVEARTNHDGSMDFLVRYVVAGARKPFYETWWPASYLVAV